MTTTKKRLLPICKVPAPDGIHMAQLFFRCIFFCDSMLLRIILLYKYKVFNQQDVSPQSIFKYNTTFAA